jgi:hypothetical protein
LFNNQWVIEEIREEIKKILKVNENKNTTYQKQWDIAKAVLRGKFITMSTYIKRTERSQINELMLHLKLIEKDEQAKLKTSLMASMSNSLDLTGSNWRLRTKTQRQT